MIPDNFFKINSDAKYNSLAGIGKEEKRHRIENFAEKKKHFDRALLGKEKSEGGEDSEENLVSKEPLSEAGDEQLIQKNRSDLIEKKGGYPLLDSTTNQPEVLAKDSKVAPRLGKEKPAAPSDLPWSEPYVEKAKDPFTQGISGKKEIPKNQEEDTPPFADSPAMLFSRLAKEGAPLKQVQMPVQNPKDQTAEDQTAEFIPPLPISSTRKESVAVDTSPQSGAMIPIEEKEEEKVVLPSKGQDQDNPLINLGALLPQSANDLIVDATKLKPMVKIPSYILELVDKISSEIKDDVSTTKITLKNVGIFNDVEVTVTSFKTARSEINIQFANMTQEAKSVLEMNLDALKQALDNKGHTVHMITATTLKEEPVSPGTPDRERQDSEPKEENRNKKQKRDQEEMP